MGKIMLRGLFVGLGLLLAGTGMAAAAETCKYQIGDAVGIPWLGDIRPAAVLTGPEGESCVYTVRFTPRPGEAMELYPRTFGQTDIVDLPGPPPYRKPFGCPYAVGEAVDFRDYYQSKPWYPATVIGVNTDCEIQVSYQDPSGEEKVDGVSMSLIEVSLRPSELERQDPETLRREADKRAAALQCQNVQNVAVDAKYQSLIDQALVEFDKGLVYPASRTVVTLEEIRTGKSFAVEENTTFLRGHTDAVPGSTATAFRVTATVCREYEGDKPVTKVQNVDLFCYPNYFDDTVCSK
jgi:hypothetical protein